MTRFINKRQKVFRRIVGILILYIMLFPTLNPIDVDAMQSASTNVKKSQLPSHPASSSIRTAQVFLDLFQETPSPSEKKLKLSEKEKLVEQGVAQFLRGERVQAKKTFEEAKLVESTNYIVPYYLGIIYLEEGRRLDAIAEWQQYALLHPESEDSLKIRKYLTLLRREEAVEYAKQAVENEAVLLRSPVVDNRVAVTTFKNLGSEDLEIISKGIAAMLIQDLSQVPGLQVVERTSLQALIEKMNLGTSGLIDQKTAAKVGRLLKSKYITIGNVANFEEENLQIVSALIDTVKMDTGSTQEAHGAMKRFYDLEKDIACKIIKNFGYDCDEMPDAFHKIHTKSFLALTAFSKGLHYIDQERYNEAIEEFQKALDNDPNFDLAEQVLWETPESKMLLMTSSDMTSTLSADGLSSTTLGSASVGTAVADDDDGLGFLGITTAVVVGAAAVVGLAAAAGGGGDDNSTAPSAAPLSEQNLTGDWVGTWSDSSGTNSGNISLTLEQNSPSVAGTVSITGSNCISTGTLSGTLTGNNLVSVIQSGSDTVSLNANCTSTSMNGTLEFTSGNCAGVIWNFSTSLTGNAIIRW